MKNTPTSEDLYITTWEAASSAWHGVDICVIIIYIVEFIDRIVMKMDVRVGR